MKEMTGANVSNCWISQKLCAILGYAGQNLFWLPQTLELAAQYLVSAGMDFQKNQTVDSDFIKRVLETQYFLEVMNPLLSTRMIRDDALCIAMDPLKHALTR